MTSISYDLNQAEGLVPVLDGNNRVVAYERTMDPKRREVLQNDKNMALMLGAWSGRIIEEQQSDKFNALLIKNLKATYDLAVKNGDTGAFINVADKKQKDAVVRDAWATMGNKLKEAAQKEFGNDVLMIRKDMVNDALGYHQASIRDAWTGVSRWSPETQRTFTDTVRLFAGNAGYKWLVRGEDAVSGLVSYAKITIVIRSLVVMRDNILSNNLHLMSWGVGPVQLAKGMRSKFIETTQYLKNQERILELNAEMSVNLQNPSKVRRIEAELQILEDANKNLSIKPLLDAGEFSTVSESLTEADVAIREGKFSEWLEIAADKVPTFAQGAFKNFVITKDTALFQGLNRAVSYGDFVAKAVLYDHLTKVRKIPVEQALKTVKGEQDFAGVAKRITSARLTSASTKEIPTTDVDLVSEMGDVAVLLDLMGVVHATDPVTKAPSERDLLEAQKRMLEIYEDVQDNPRKFNGYKPELAQIMSWFTSPSDRKGNADRQARAMKHAEKYGKGNLEAHYLIQVIEELGEVLVERDRIGGSTGNQNQKGLEIQKRAFKVLRFGAETVNKGAGKYQGKTNLEAFNMAQGGRSTSSDQDGSNVERNYTHEEAMRIIKEEFVNYNRLAGRDRDYLEGLGMMWFWNYKIRIMKVLGRMARERPASLVLWTGGIAPMLDVDSATSGSLVGAWDKGTLGYKIGPEMGWNSMTMNPWVSQISGPIRSALTL